MLATIGTDPSAGVQRFTFGSLDLVDGISFLLLAMATFALSEALMTVLKGGSLSPQAKACGKEQLRQSENQPRGD